MIVEPLRQLSEKVKKGHSTKKYRRRNYHYNDEYLTVAKLIPLENQFPIEYYFSFSMPLELKDDEDEILRYCRNIMYTYCFHPNPKYNWVIKSLPHKKDWSDWGVKIVIELPVLLAKKYIWERQPVSRPLAGGWRETLIIDNKTGETMQVSSAQNAAIWIWNYMLTDEEREKLVYETWYNTARRWGIRKSSQDKRFEFKYLSERKPPPLVIPERHGLYAANKAAEAAAKWLNKDNKINEDADEYDELAEIF